MKIKTVNGVFIATVFLCFWTFRVQSQGIENTNLIQSQISNAENKGDKILADSISKAYIENYLLNLNEHDLFAKEKLVFLGNHVGEVNSRTYNFFKNNIEKVNGVLGYYQAQNVLMTCIGKNYLPAINTWNSINPNWNSIQKSVSQKFGALGVEKVYEQRMIYYRFKQDWKNYGIWYKKYLEKYLFNTSYDPNFLTWTVFEHVEDRIVLKFATDFVMPYSLEKWYANDYQVYDTYANLLYKIGRKEEAIKWEERSAKLSNNEKSIIETLEKMKNGQQTWPLISNK